MKRKQLLFLLFRKQTIQLVIMHLLLIGIIIMCYELIQLNKISYPIQKAQADLTDAKDSCNKVNFTYKENVSCPELHTEKPGVCTPNNTSKKNNVSSYIWTVTISSKDKKAHTITYQRGTHFCASGYKTWDGGSGYCTCSDNANVQVVKQSVPATGTITLTFNQANPYGKVCGTWQYDLNVTDVDGNANCGFSKGLASGNCETGISCTGPAATPTPALKATPTPTAPGKSIFNLDFGITNSFAWIQSSCGDVRVDDGIGDNLPIGIQAIITDTNCSTPGIAFSGDTDPNFGQGTVSSTGQIIGGLSYPEIFHSSSALGTSYSSLLTKAQNASITPINLATKCNLTNCTLPANLAHGIYIANGDVTLNAVTKLKNSSNYIFLINGTLTLNGITSVPKGSTALFSTTKNIIVSPAVGSAVTATASNLAGWFVAGQNFIVNSKGNCNDLRLNVAGAVIANAMGNGGTFQNNRDLCGNDLTYPTISITQRLDMILNAPQFLKQQQTISQEIAP